MSFGLPELIIILVVVFGQLFWIWMLIDCALNEPSGSDKIVWIIIIVFASCVGALIYYFVRRPNRIAESGG